MLLAKCVQELIRHSQIPFEATYMVMNPGYNQENLDKILYNLDVLGIPAHVFESSIFDYVVGQEGSPCYLCARMRRGYLYKEAQSLGCNKIALGHHFDDAIETTLLSMLYGAEIKTMMPKLKSTNYEGMELIRPLYMIKEADIIHWTVYNELSFIRCACRFTEEQEQRGIDDIEGGHKRQEVKELIKKLRETNPYIDTNIFKSVHNVNLATIIGYRESDNGKQHTFLENF
ncbi:tRNA 2-thiocytidine biosynthesis protein TtcA [bioreactor metagenome]|uniref:tRNA 2-thiocytidine biosynthesis protein TtcA n=1 Tax=bioreactor metagenome TaxID=1076179 RepID=A0A645FSJ9_9ZZZZ